MDGRTLKIQLVGDATGEAETRRRELEGAGPGTDASVAAVEAPHNTPDVTLCGLFRITPDGHLLAANTAFARMLGYSSVDDLMQRGCLLPLAAALREGGKQPAELRLETASGPAVWLRAEAKAVADSVLEGSAIDISETRRERERIVQLSRHYSVLSRLAHAVAGSSDDLLSELCRISVEDGGFRSAWVGTVNDESRVVEPAAQFGIGADDVRRLRISCADIPEGRGPTGLALREGRHIVVDDVQTDPSMAPWREWATRHGCRSVAAFPIQMHGRLFGALTLYSSRPGAFDSSNVELLEEVAGHVGFAMESQDRETQRLKAEFERARLTLSEQAARAQARAEARFHELMEATPDAILEVDRSGTILLMNAAAERLFGYSREELTGQVLEILLPEPFRKAHVKQRESYFAAGAGANFVHRREVTGMRKGGAGFPAEVSLSVVNSATGDLVSCVVRDISYRKQAERALRESSRQVADILETIGDGFCAFDRNWRFTYLNRNAERITGRKREELLGKVIWDEFAVLKQSEFYGRCKDAIRGTTPFEFSGEFGKSWIEIHAYPSEKGLSVYFQDITARKQLEEQFQQSQKLEALGRLAGGVAHDFNNLLTIIGGYGQMLLESTGDANPIKRDLEAIVEAANRASGLTRQLLAFSKRQMVQPKILDLNRAVAKMDKMLRRLIGEDMELSVSLDSGAGRIKADPSQVEQVLLNLVVNARDAMPHGGRLTVSTSSVVLDGSQAGGPELPAGAYAVLSVADTGTGMDAEVLSRIFEPFFTTKPKGKGTGLGLSTVYGIVKQSGGDIAVETAPGKGTTFRIYLAQVEGRTKPARTRKSKPAAGGETVLLVEDDAEVRHLTCAMLASQGYRVLAADSGAEALRLYRENRDAIDLVITDIIMPHISGIALAQTLREEEPLVKVLFISGYTDDVISEHGSLTHADQLLHKPFTRGVLASRVRKILDTKT